MSGSFLARPSVGLGRRDAIRMEDRRWRTSELRLFRDRSGDDLAEPDGTAMGVLPTMWNSVRFPFAGALAARCRSSSHTKPIDTRMPSNSVVGCRGGPGMRTADGDTPGAAVGVAGRSGTPSRRGLLRGRRSICQSSGGCTRRDLEANEVGDLVGALCGWCAGWVERLPGSAAGHVTVTDFPTGDERCRCR